MALETSKPVLHTLGDYEIVDKIAEGGMGTIYRGRHVGTGEIVALKVMPAKMAENPVLLKRFEQEFHAASRLDHPNIVRALEFGREGSTPYLVMEFVEGESLGQKIEREGAIPEAAAIKLIAQVAQGLYRAHNLQMIHRDVKPDNVLVTPDGRAKLADLGLVKETETDLNLTKTGRGLGTPHFMAPEQFRNAKNVDLRSDIYSLGATLYMMVTGELPFRSSGPLDAWLKKINNELVAPRQIRPELSERIDWAIRRAMSADQDRRPASCREFIEDLTGKAIRRAQGDAQHATGEDVWYLCYRDEEGKTHTAKGTTPALRRCLKDGLLGDASNVRASRAKTGPFEELSQFPEFRDLLIQPAPVAPPKPTAKPKVEPALEPVAATRAVGAKRVPKPQLAKSTAPSVCDSPTTEYEETKSSEEMSNSFAPHIDLGFDNNRSTVSLGDLLKWSVLLLVTVGAGFLGWYAFTHR